MRSYLNTKNKILSGAKSLLLKCGHDEFTIRAIATTAGVNPGLVHHYFGSKEKLILALIDFIFSESRLYSLHSRDYMELLDIRGCDMQQLMNKSLDFFRAFIELVYLSKHSLLIRKKLKDVLGKQWRYFTATLGNSWEREYCLEFAGVLGVILLGRVDNTLDEKALIHSLLNRLA